MRTIEREVVIVGGGPSGVTLASLLAGYGVSTLVIDREQEVLDEPRAVGIDDEAIRTMQSFGMAEAVLEDAVRNAPIRYYDSRRRVLAHVAPSGRPFGWPRRNLFFQPTLERVLRAGLEKQDDVELRTGCTAVGLQQDDDGVVILAEEGGERFAIRAQYAVGADGGRSFVRRAADIALLGETAPMKWLVVDVEEDTWDAPYSAVFTTPERPSMTIPLPFGHRRFEFKILDGEDADSMAEPATVERLMKPFYPDSPVPPAIRRRIYWHHSRTAETFNVGRVFLVGDAAHLQPPFFGQGMNSGIRDVTNLAWKLGFVLTGRAAPGLLATYDSERRETAREMVDFATGIGRLYHPRNRLTEAVRNAVFRGVQRLPGGRDYILQMKYKPVPRYRDGFVLLSRDTDKGSLAGRALPQPLVQRLDGSRVRLDDVLGSSLAVVGLVPGVVEALDPGVAGRLRTHGGVVVQSHVMPAYRRAGQFDPTARGDSDLPVVDVHDFDGGLRDMHLARPGDEVYVVRPDRYVAAVCSVDEVNQVLDRLLDMVEQPAAVGGSAPPNGRSENTERSIRPSP